MKRWMAILLVSYAAAVASAEPPMPLTLGGMVNPFADDLSPTGVAWRVYAVAGTTQSVAGSFSISSTTVESFESGDFSSWPWEMDTHEPWIVENTDAYSGTYAAEVSPGGWLQVTVNCGSGAVSFARQVALGSFGIGELNFYIDWGFQGHWRQNVGWDTVSFPVTAGTHTFYWEFWSFGSGARARIDEVQVPFPRQPVAWYGEAACGQGTAFRVGTEQMATMAVEDGAGAPSHRGYYAVMNQTLTGDDPAVFDPVTLRPIPIPDASADGWAYLDWADATEDAGEAGKTNIVGYYVSRSMDGVNSIRITPGKITKTFFVDSIPDDAEYYYEIGLVYRGSPNATSSVVSANSTRVFKDSNWDALPDYFCIAAGLDPEASDFDSGPSGDPNHTGMSNYQRWIAGTFPPNPNSVLAADDVEALGSGIVIRWDGVAGRSYTVDRLSDLSLTNWQSFYGPVSCPTDQPMSCTDAISNTVTQRFYRIGVQKD